MNQPTREEFEAFKSELREEVRKLREQITEPITIPRIELDPGGIQNRLDNHAEIMKEISRKQDEQEQSLTLIYTDVGHMKVDIGKLKGAVGELKTDMEQVKTVQSGHSKYFEEHGRRLSQIEATMATKDDIGRLEGIMVQILNRLPKAEGE